MSIQNIDIAGNISVSSNFDNDDGTDRDTPVVYRIYWSSSTPAFTIALHVPNHSVNDPHDNCNNLANEPEKKKLSPKPETHHQISTPWLDRSKLREQLVKGVCTIGLEFSA